MSQPTNGGAAAAFQSACAAAGIPLQGLDETSALQWALASLLGLGANAGTGTIAGNLLIAGTLTVNGLETEANNIVPAIDGAGQVGTSLLRFSNAHFVNGEFSTLTLPILGGGGGAVSIGIADSGGAGFRLLRVPN